MEYRGKKYSVLQRLDTKWNWSVPELAGTKSGVSPSHAAGVKAAQRAIDNAVAPKKKWLVPCRRPADYFSRRTPLNFFAAVFFLAGFLTAMNSPDVLLRLVQAVTPPSLRRPGGRCSTNRARPYFRN